MKVNELITWPTLCVFGDSIVVGSDDREAGGWVARLKLDLNARGKIGVYNLGVDGDRTEQLLRRLAGEAAARNASVIVISIGANDLGWHGTSGTDITLFRERYDHILSEAEQFTRRILVLGLLNVDEGNARAGQLRRRLTPERLWPRQAGASDRAGARAPGLGRVDPRLVASEPAPIYSGYPPGCASPCCSLRAYRSCPLARPRPSRSQLPRGFS